MEAERLKRGLAGADVDVDGPGVEKEERRETLMLGGARF